MKMNPPMNRRNVEIVVKTRGVSSLWDEPAGGLMTGRAATGVEGRESDAGAAAELQEPVASMEREKHKRRRPRGEITDAEHWDGPIRISDEGS
ncbi:hypothetical protein SAMN05216337_101046 [Bradyrhizobium brasilense]|uniref:Uncharacterized protein n=1 Tax=Bradyrhizobium brasilense TaxID=1419277 RepID=A0A1G6TZM6_9BRAD|nr:hypothetical protein [Bradyrhizobium brasilense]SDD33745.1 hypothetical protein SAMN05216337_101046 [Bradyrhizobium brasilense]